VRTTLQRLDVYLPNGDLISELTGDPSTCPDELASLPCTQAIYVGQTAQSVRLNAVTPSGIEVTGDIPILAKGHCGKDVAYVQVIVDSTNEVRLAEPRYISPCP
jgi:hypothetical protein